MRSFFNPENWLWRGFGRVADFFLLSCCWFLVSIPIVTIPAACIALYDTTAHCVLGNDGGTYARFFRTWKAELKRSVLIALLWLAIAFLLGTGYQILCQRVQADADQAMFAIVYYFSLTIPVAVFCWLLAVESRFVYGFGQLHKMAFYFTFAHLPTTVCIVAVALVTYDLCARTLFLVMVLPGICAYIQSIFIERVFLKYLPKEETEEATAGA